MTLSLRTLPALLSVLPMLLGSSADPAGAQARQPDASSTARAVNAIAERAIAGGAGPGLGVAVVMQGRVIHLRSYGMADVTRGIRADSSTLWYLASTSKSFTGFAVSMLANEGLLSIDAPIATLLPNARWHADVRPEELTLRHFLTHTMGLSAGAVVMQAAFVGSIPERDWPGLLQWSTPLPTRDMIYNNLGYNVAAMVIDRLRPEGWRAYMDARVFGPVGMRETFARVSGLDERRIAKPHELHEDGTFTTEPFFKTDVTMNSAGGRLSTLADLARWTLVQMDSGVVEGRRVFPASAVQRSQTQLAEHTRDQSRRFAFFERTGWAAGWDIGSHEGERMVSRFGSYHSTRSHLSFLPARRVGVVAATNGDPGSRVTDIIAAMVYDLEAGRPEAMSRANSRLDELLTALRGPGYASIARGDSVRRSRQAQAFPRGWDAYAGTYEHPGYGIITFERERSGLRYRWGALHGPVEIYDAAKDQLRYPMPGSGAIAQFRFGPSGPAQAVILEGVEFTRRNR